MQYLCCPRIARLEGQADFHIPVELAENRNQPVEREAAQLGIADAGKFGMRNAGQFLGIPRGKLSIVKRADNFRGNDRARLFQSGAGAAEIAVNIAAAADQFKFSSFILKRPSIF